MSLLLFLSSISGNLCPLFLVMVQFVVYPGSGNDSKSKRDMINRIHIAISVNINQKTQQKDSSYSSLIVSLEKYFGLYFQKFWHDTYRLYLHKMYSIHVSIKIIFWINKESYNDGLWSHGNKCWSLIFLIRPLFSSATLIIFIFENWYFVIRTFYVIRVGKWYKRRKI